MTRRAVAAIALGCAALAVAARVPLLWDDPYAPGYDGYYYVLQARSTLAGAPLFADGSLLYPALALLGSALGDVVLGDKVAACALAACTAACGVIAGYRWTGSTAGAAAIGAWWAVSPLHLGVSADYLKQAAGVAALAALLAALPDTRRWPAALLAILGIFVHKATGLLGLMVALAYVVGAAARPTRDRQVWAGVALAAVAALAGLLRPTDWARLGDAGGSRLALLSGVLSPAEAAEAALVHLAPLGLAAALLGPAGRPLRPLGGPLLLLAVACVAPGLPFGWDLTAWRLLLLGFVGLGALAAAAAARLGWPVTVVVAAVGVAQLPSSVAHQARREPEYAAWAPMLTVVRAHVGASERVVAHRGVCGFLWAEGGVPCETYQPAPPWDGWWRVAYGMGEARLQPYSDTPVVPLIPGYTLVREPAWQAFRADHVDRFDLLRDDTNPWTPRPDYAYGPR